MPTWQPAFPQSKPFKCCTAWHLWKSGQSLAIYTFLGALTNGGKNSFFSSERRIADYFGMNYRAACRAIGVLRLKGFIERRGDGHLYYVSHDDWMKTHPGQCTKREILPWQECTDPVVGEIYKIAGGKIRVQEWQIKAIRKYAGGDAKFIEEFRNEMELVAPRRVPGGNWEGTSPRQCFIRVYKRLRDSARAAAG